MRRLPFEGRLLVCDMDGTLLNSSSKLSTGNVKALERFVEGGGMFTVATGRMEKSVLPYLDMLPVNVPAIVYNGAAIYDFKTDRILWQTELDPAVAGPVSDAMVKFPEISVQVYHGGRTYFVAENKHSEAHRIREHLEPVRTGLDGVPVPWLKIIIALDPPKLRYVEEFLKGFEGKRCEEIGIEGIGCKGIGIEEIGHEGIGFEGKGCEEIGFEEKGCEEISCSKKGRDVKGSNLRFRQVYSEPQFLELLDPDATKGSALKVLTGMLGLERSCVISMGDNLNDIELIEEAGTGIAVGNAHSAVKAAADMCCTNNNNDAVAEVISWLENGKIPL